MFRITWSADVTLRHIEIAIFDIISRRPPDVYYITQSVTKS